MLLATHALKADAKAVQDDYRLPEGMRRIGYDADTQTYTYRHSNGSVWEGAPGNRYGTLTPIRGPTYTVRPSADEGTDGRSSPASDQEPTKDDENPRESTMQSLRRRFTDFGQLAQHDDPVIRREDWKLLAPFLLLVCLVLLVVWRMLKVDTATDIDQK